MWSYVPASKPITHTAGSVPVRPLEPGDTVNWGRDYSETVLAVSDSQLILVKPNGGLLVMHRRPIEGDNSQSIIGMPIEGN